MQRNFLPSSEFCITPKYTMNDTLYNFLHFNFDPNKDKYQQMINELKNKWDYERKQICIEYINKESVLSYAFLYYVYNDDTISFEYVQSVLGYEINPLLRNLTDKYEKEFKMLFDSCLKFYNESYVNAYWFLFWNDIWENNQNVKLITEYQNQRYFNCDPIYQSILRQEIGCAQSV